MGWRLSHSADPAALAVVDGLGRFAEFGPHYSRRTPGSRTFTGVGQEIVLITDCGRAVWACVYQKTPSAKGSGSSRGRTGQTDQAARFLWRNMLFRNLGAGLSSELIREALAVTYGAWVSRYGILPPERLRTEIDVGAVRSTNPGFCYLKAGWERGPLKRGKLFLFAPADRGAVTRLAVNIPASGVGGPASPARFPTEQATAPDAPFQLGLPL